MEIEYNLNLELEQIKILDNHSVLNILNVVVYELMLLSEILKNPSDIDDLMHEVYQAANSITKGVFYCSDLTYLDELKDRLLSGIEALAVDSGVEKGDVYSDSYFNLRGIFEILRVRIIEMNQRKDNPTAWECFSCEQLKRSLLQVYEAISINSKRAYTFVFDAAQRHEQNYLLNLEVTGGEDGLLLMPPVFQDVIRDLAANSRKYTPVGGELGVAINETQGIFKADVWDTGIGIPMDEMPDILRFGYRASNARGKRTMGGGFGLTKAYYLVRLFNGRMWIDSSTQASKSGTRIKIEVPIPEYDPHPPRTVGSLVVPN